MYHDGESDFYPFFSKIIQFKLAFHNLKRNSIKLELEIVSGFPAAFMPCRFQCSGIFFENGFKESSPSLCSRVQNRCELALCLMPYALFCGSQW